MAWKVRHVPSGSGFHQPPSCRACGPGRHRGNGAHRRLPDPGTGPSGPDLAIPPRPKPVRFLPAETGPPAGAGAPDHARRRRGRRRTPHPILPRRHHPEMAQRRPDRGKEDLRNSHGDADPGGRVDSIVVGIGVNLNMEKGEFHEDFRETSTSLREETGRAVDRKRSPVPSSRAWRRGATGTGRRGFPRSASDGCPSPGSSGRPFPRGTERRRFGAAFSTWTPPGPWCSKTKGDAFIPFMPERSRWRNAERSGTGDNRDPGSRHYLH
jgi:hypothetical protein